MPWTNDMTYVSKSIIPGVVYTGGGCAAFAFELSDAAFGDLPAREHHSISDIRVGDIIRVKNDTHSVIVLEVHSDGVIVAEGNYNYSVHWGRFISNSELGETLTYIWTRYP